MLTGAQAARSLDPSDDCRDLAIRCRALTRRSDASITCAHCSGGVPIVMGGWGALAGATVLLLVLLAWVRAEASSKDSRSDWDASLREQGEGVEACSPEIVSQIFSVNDLKFISGLESPGLERLFRRYFGKEAKSELFLRWLATQTASYKASTIRARP